MGRMVSKNSSAGLTHPTSPPASLVKLQALMAEAVVWKSWPLLISAKSASHSSSV